MPIITFADGTKGIACFRDKRLVCAYCGDISTRLCDYPTYKYKSGKKKGKWKTCDVRLCDDCTQTGVSKETDFCKKHFPLAKAAYERRKRNAGENKSLPK